MANCTILQDTDFERSRAFLKTDCEDAHKLALDALGGVTYVNRADFEFIPPEEPDVLVSSDYREWQKDYKFAKLQKEFSNFLGQKALKDITSGLDKYAHVTNSDLIRSLLARRKPGDSQPQ